jgi:SAM-dependent methyltransferase
MFMYSLIDIFPKTGPDGLPLPPANLRFLVAGTRDTDWFIEGGKLGADSIAQVLSKNGVCLDKLPAILDFGCGAGRVMRHWRHLPVTAVYGSDYNHKLIKWCRKNLTFASFATNKLEPPLPYEDEKFDLIYALSVFTHLTQPLQMAWMAELKRNLKPGGHLLLTTHGEYYMSHLMEDQQKQFQAGQVVVLLDRSAGKNACAAFHPPVYVRETLASSLDIIDFLPEGASGNPRQDLWLLRKPFH